jgi:hypothetical protein
LHRVAPTILSPSSSVQSCRTYCPEIHPSPSLQARYALSFAPHATPPQAPHGFPFNEHLRNPAALFFFFENLTKTIVYQFRGFKRCEIFFAPEQPRDRQDDVEFDEPIWSELIDADIFLNKAGLSLGSSPIVE